jgi:two-component system, LytTR family, response regulator LytT
MKIVIIEDEKITAKDLARTIIEIDDSIEILTILHSVEEAIDYLKNNPTIDLIFSDIQLGDGLSFEIFEAVNNQIPIIFCTAFNEYALDAFKTIGIDYLLKPFTKTTVSKALEKYHAMKENFSHTEDTLSTLMNALKSHTNPTKIASVIIQQGDKIIPLRIENIALFYIQDAYVFAYTFDQKNHILSQKMEDLEKNFYPSFFRANRQYLVNRKAIKDASHYFNRKVIINLTLAFKEQITVGKLKVTPFIDWLANS